MQALTLLLLPAAALAGVVRRADPSSYTPLQPVGTDILKPQVRASAQRKLVKYGPVTMLGYNDTKPGSYSMDAHGQTYDLTLAGLCPGGCTILGAMVGAMLVNGSKADPTENGIYTHHILTQDVSQTGGTFVSMCTANDTASLMKSAPATGVAPGITTQKSGYEQKGFVGTGDDNRSGYQLFTSVGGKYNSGYWVGENDNFMIEADMVNYHPEHRQIYFFMDIEYVPGNVGEDASIQLLSVGGCGVMPLKTSMTGPVNTTSEKFAFYQDGTILWAQGHLHDGGDNMVLFLNDQPICESKAIYGKTAADINGKTWETIAELAQCSGPIPVKRGDSLSMTAIYDLAAHPLRPGSSTEMGGMDINDLMGMYTLTFAPSSK